MISFLERIRTGPALLLDGGLGSMLIARGLPLGEPPEIWTLGRSREVLNVHRAYVDAGSEAIHTNTFGANPVRLGRFGLVGRLEALNRGAVRLAREAGARWVIGDIGPTGEKFTPEKEAAWREGYRKQACCLIDSGVDALHLETMTDVRVATLALRALRDAAPRVPILASLVFHRAGEGFATPAGDPVSALAALIKEGAALAGVNCGMTSGPMSELVAACAPMVEPRLLVIQPSGGLPERVGATLLYQGDADAFARDLGDLVTRGVAAVGGCCGTDPSFIAALRARIDDVV